MSPRVLPMRGRASLGLLSLGALERHLDRTDQQDGRLASYRRVCNVWLCAVAGGLYDKAIRWMLRAVASLHSLRQPERLNCCRWRGSTTAIQSILLWPSKILVLG